MIDLAQKNAQKVEAQNVGFRLGEMEDMPLEDDSIDVIISNCVINLSPDKDRVFAEAYRVLKPGGRMMISDLVTEGDLPPAVKESVEAWVGCVAGALDNKEYLEKIEAAGFIDLKTRVGGSPTLEGQTPISTNGPSISMWRATNPPHGERIERGMDFHPASYFVVYFL